MESACQWKGRFQSNCLNNETLFFVQQRTSFWSSFDIGNIKNRNWTSWKSLLTPMQAMGTKQTLQTKNSMCAEEQRLLPYRKNVLDGLVQGKSRCEPSWKLVSVECAHRHPFRSLSIGNTRKFTHILHYRTITTNSELHTLPSLTHHIRKWSIVTDIRDYWACNPCYCKELPLRKQGRTHDSGRPGTLRQLFIGYHREQSLKLQKD